MNIKARLILMNFLQFAVWGLSDIDGDLSGGIGLGNHIGIFYAMQGIVSLFMPAIMGIIADRWVPHNVCWASVTYWPPCLWEGGILWNGFGNAVSFEVLFAFYSVSVAFYMPTLALSNSVAYSALDQAVWIPSKLSRRSGLLEPLVLSVPCGWLIYWDSRLPQPVLHLCCLGSSAGSLCQYAAECPTSGGGQEKNLLLKPWA